MLAAQLHNASLSAVGHTFILLLVIVDANLSALNFVLLFQALFDDTIFIKYNEEVSQQLLDSTSLEQ